MSPPQGPETSLPGAFRAGWLATQLNLLGGERSPLGCSVSVFKHIWNNHGQGSDWRTVSCVCGRSGSEA